MPFVPLHALPGEDDAVEPRANRNSAPQRGQEMNVMRTATIDPRANFYFSVGVLLFVTLAILAA